MLFQNCLLAAIVILNTSWAVDAAEPAATIDPKLIREQFDVAKDGEPLLLPVRFQNRTYFFLLDTVDKRRSLPHSRQVLALHFTNCATEAGLLPCNIS
jgi:hypothetical protein